MRQWLHLCCLMFLLVTQIESSEHHIQIKGHPESVEAGAPFVINLNIVIDTETLLELSKIRNNPFQVDAFSVLFLEEKQLQSKSNNQHLIWSYRITGTQEGYFPLGVSYKNIVSPTEIIHILSPKNQSLYQEIDTETLLPLPGYSNNKLNKQNKQNLNSLSDPELIQKENNTILVNRTMPKYILFTLLLGLLVTLLYKPFIKLRTLLPKKEKSLVSPKNIALQAISNLENKQLPEAGEFKAFHEILSSIMRKYIEGAYQIKAPEQSTEEFLHDLDIVQNCSEETKNIFAQFLKTADLVKFAKESSTKEHCHEMLRTSKKLVNES